MKINVCCIGEPLNERTWSGTALNICNALKQKNALANTFSTDVRLKGRLLKASNFFLNMYYSKSADLERGFFYRFLRAKYSEKCTEKSNSKHTLHLGTLDLPFIIKPKNQSHYLYVDSTWHLWSSDSTNMSWNKKKLIKHAEQLERIAYIQARHIFTISEYVKVNLINHYRISEDKITVAGTGRGIIKPYFGEKDYTNGRILFTAKDRFEDKGGPLLLNAFKIAFEKNSRLKLCIVGQDKYLETINHPGIQTFGFVPVEKLQSVFNESSLFVMPAKNEPWGLVYLEALACKIPIVGLYKNSFPEISQEGNYGFSMKEETPEKLASLILNAFSNTDLLFRMGSEGQTFCLNKFSWENTVTTIINTIENIL